VLLAPQTPPAQAVKQHTLGMEVNALLIAHLFLYARLAITPLSSIALLALPDTIPSAIFARQDVETAF
jgi:hypothetical protein